MESNLTSKMQEQGLPTSAGHYPGVIMFGDEDDEIRTNETAQDGGPGSGNFGHKGRPGKVGGSGPGGGKQYRGGRADIGYYSSKKDWLNGLTGEKQHEASKFMKAAKEKLDELTQDANGYKKKLDIMVKNGYFTEEEAKAAWNRSAYSKLHEGMTPEGYIMKAHPMEGDKKKLVDMVGEARSWGETGMRLQIENLTPQENVALTSMVWKYDDENPGVLSQDEMLHNNLDKVFDDLEPEQKQFYLDMKAKSCGIENSGKQLSDYSNDFQISVGAKEPEKKPEDWYDWMDSDKLGLTIKSHNLPSNLAYAAGKPSGSQFFPKTNAERQEMWKQVIDDVKYNNQMGTPRLIAAARIARYASYPNMDKWKKQVERANETYSSDFEGFEKLPNLDNEESKRFLQILSMSKSHDSDMTWGDADRLEQSVIDNLDGQALRDYILLKNKIVGGPEPSSEDEMKNKEAKKKEETKAKQRAFTENYAERKKRYEDATTPADVCKILSESGAFKDGAQVSLTGCSRANATKIAITADKFIQRFPFLFHELGGIGTDEYRSDVYAHSERMSGGKINVNASYNFFGGIDAELRYERNVQDNFHPAGTHYDSIITHELAHSLGGWLSKKRVLGSSFSSRDSNSFEGILRRRVLKQLKMTKASVQQELCEYATKNAMEWFAEAIAEAVHSPNPRPMAAETMRQLTEILKGEGLLDGESV